MFNKQGFVLTMKKKGLQQHNFTIHLTEQRSIYYFFYQVYTLFLKLIGTTSLCVVIRVLGMGLKYLGCLSGRVALPYFCYVFT